LIKQIAINLPDIDPMLALGIGATQIRSKFTPAQVPLVIDAYMTGLQAVFAITVAAFGVATLIGFFGSWKRLHSKDMQKITGGAA
jgi:ABC-type proline/glycine betaine transport system permease subunit